EVRGGIALIDVAGLVLGPAEVEDALGRGGFARVDVRDDADVANVLEHGCQPTGQATWGGTPEKKQASRRAEPNFRRDLPHRSDGLYDPGHPANTTSRPPRRGRTREPGYSGETRLNLAETCLPRRKAEERGSLPVWWSRGHGSPIDPGVCCKISILADCDKKSRDPENLL